MKIKKVIREDFPETNSSSSHSVIISMNSNKITNRKDWKLNIDEQTQTLYIPSFSDFGRGFFSSNSTLTKLQYVSCYFIKGLYLNKVGMGKAIHKFESVLKSILGIKHVVFEEAVDIWTRFKDGSIPPEDTCYYEFPQIDWQSYYLNEEILETPETLKNFLLNPESWLYGGDDSMDPISSRYSSTQIQPSPIGYYSAYIQGIGRVDVEITPISDISSEIRRVFSNFCYNTISSEFMMTGEIDSDVIDLKKDILEYRGFYEDDMYILYSTFNVSNDEEDDQIKVQLTTTIYDITWLSI